MSKEADDKLISLCIIKNGSLKFIADLFAFADEWTKENDYGKAFVRNTDDGMYEILAESIH